MVRNCRRAGSALDQRCDLVWLHDALFRHELADEIGRREIPRAVLRQVARLGAVVGRELQDFTRHGDCDPSLARSAG
jgi:hypothetical protein